jgi:hypothetical protein
VADQKGVEVNHVSEVREYSAGEEILVRLTVDHRFELRPVAAVFEHGGFAHAAREGHGEDYLIVLTGSEILQQRRLPSAPPQITSTVVLRGQLTPDKAIGEYRCTRIEAEYRGGRQIPFDLEETPEIRFRVVEDTVSNPKVTRWEYINDVTQEPPQTPTEAASESEG